jgi:ACS family glucarate transporter-like MFS transporter
MSTHPIRPAVTADTSITPTPLGDVVQVSRDGRSLPPGAFGRPSHIRFGVLGFACSLSLLTYLDRICIMRARENIQADLGFSDIEMGLIFSAFTLGYALFEVPGGWLGDVLGSRRVIARIVLCWSLFTALTGCVWHFALDSGRVLSLGRFDVPLVFNSLLALLLVRFLFGVGEAGAYPNLARVVRGWFPFQERALAQGAIWMCARVGGAFAPLLIGRLSAALGWRQAFWVLGATGICWCAAFYWWFRDTPEEKANCNQAERDLIHGYPPPSSVQEEGHGHALPPWRCLFFSLTTWSLCAASCFVCFGWYFYPTWQPEYLKEVFGISYTGSELITGLPFLCGAVGSLLGGGLSDYLVRRTGNRRWGRSVIGVVGFTAAGLCVLATGFAATAWQAVALLCLAFLVNDLAIPVIWAACADVGGRYAGTVAGLMNMAGGVGAFISPILIPVILTMTRHFSGPERWRLIFAGLAVSWFLGALAWVFIDASKPLFSEEVRSP